MDMARGSYLLHRNEPAWPQGLVMEAPKSYGDGDKMSLLEDLTARAVGLRRQVRGVWRDKRRVLSEDEEYNPTSRREPPHKRSGNKPVTPAHDRRHDDPEVRAEDPARLLAEGQELHGLSSPPDHLVGLITRSFVPSLPEP